MNPYDRSPAFGKCLTFHLYVKDLAWFDPELFIVILQAYFHFFVTTNLLYFFFLQLLVLMACAVRAESSKSGMAVVPPKESQKVR